MLRKNKFLHILLSLSLVFSFIIPQLGVVFCTEEGGGTHLEIGYCNECNPIQSETSGVYTNCSDESINNQDIQKGNFFDLYLTLSEGAFNFLKLPLKIVLRAQILDKSPFFIACLKTVLLLI